MAERAEDARALGEGGHGILVHDTSALPFVGAGDDDLDKLVLDQQQHDGLGELPLRLSHGLR